LANRLKSLLLFAINLVVISCSQGGSHHFPPVRTGHGKTVLCDSGTGTLPGSVTITNNLTNHVLPRVIGPGTSVRDVCAIINEAATDLSIGFTTDYGNEAAGTAFDIFAAEASDIGIEFQNITLQIQSF
jgi:hypothetical protein